MILVLAINSISLKVGQIGNILLQCIEDSNSLPKNLAIIFGSGGRGGIIHIVLLLENMVLLRTVPRYLII